MMLRPLLRSATRCYPLSSGCGTIANSPLFRKLDPGSRDLQTTRLRGGAKIDVRLDDYVGRSIYYFGDLDPKITYLCRRLLRRGDAVLDVGANWGLVSLTAAGLVGPSGVVHAFEPQPELSEAVRRSATLNGFAHVHVHAIALSSQDGTFDLYVPADNSGSASLTRGDGALNSSSGPVVVEVRQTSRYLAGLDLPPVRLMKIDVEGHEEDVLQGGDEFLRATPPETILFESNDRTLPFWSRPVVRQMHALDYRLIAVGKGLLGPRLLTLGDGVEPPDDVNDYLAIHTRGFRSIASTLHLARLNRP